MKHILMVASFLVLVFVVGAWSAHAQARRVVWVVTLYHGNVGQTFGTYRDADTARADVDALNDPTVWAVIQPVPYVAGGGQ